MIHAAEASVSVAMALIPPEPPPVTDDVAALWRAHRHWVAAVLHAHRPRQVGSPDLEDLLQEVALVLVRKQHELRSVQSIEPWLRTVAVNVARDAGRRATVAGRVNPNDLARGNADDCSATEQDPASPAARALQIAESLPMTYSEPLLLSLRGLSYRQICRVLDLPQSTIQNRLFRARQMVRDALQERSMLPSLRLTHPNRSEVHG